MAAKIPSPSAPIPISNVQKPAPHAGKIQNTAVKMPTPQAPGLLSAPLKALPPALDLTQEPGLLVCFDALNLKLLPAPSSSGK